ncbi:MAG: Peptidyl-prolyl isomerase cwc27 [Candelina mexicana]|nr:MAG: Peptidyl-prolyl isomerase cwc27 [Candelina mexicana]
MSALYNLEPQPTAKVLLQTTSGDILLELFAKQTPLTCRNFLQLCLDGYYNNTIFHRLIPGFVLQGGDPTGTGEGGEAIYDGGLFADEFHSRLKFNRRGLLGMANTGRKNDNGSQFFLTLGKTEELQGRNTMFGRVVGDTIYNVVKMGEAEVGEGERPVYPTKITGAEVLVNPFEDMVRRELRSKGTVEEKKEVKKKLKKKAGKALLSFGAEEGEDVGVAPATKKAKYNTKLINVDLADKGKMDVDERTNEAPKDVQDKPEKPIKRRKTASPSPLRDTQPPPHRSILQRKAPSPARSPSSSPEPAEVGKVTSLLDKTNAQIAELKASMKRNIPAAPSDTGRKKSALEQMIPENSVRARKRKHGRANGTAADEKRALDILDAFKAKLDNAPPESKPATSSLQDLDIERKTHNGNGTADAAEEEEEAHLCDLHFIVNCQSCKSWDAHATDNADPQDDGDKGWLSHALTFEKDRLGKDLSWKRKNEEDLVVIDPREKAKGMKEERKAKRESRKSGNTAWDRDRDRGREPERMAGGLESRSKR